MVVLKKSNIREATDSDISTLLDLSVKMHAEGSYRDIKFSKEKMENFLRKKINNTNSLVIVWSTHTNQIFGFFIADIVEYFFSYEKVVLDTIFFIIKEKRKSIGAKLLLDSYIKWAKSNNVKEIVLSTTNDVEVEKIEKMYSKLDFTKSGVLYKKGVNYKET